MDLIIVIGVIVFALIMLNAIFLGILLFMRRKVNQVSDWPSTQGVITSSTLESRPSEDGYTEFPAVRYSYQVGEQAHKGNRIAPGIDVGGRGARKAIQRYAMGAPVTVYYNPRNPADAVLEKKAPAQAMLWIVMGVFDCLLCAAIPLAVWMLAYNA
jgi:hypothetical protein